MHKISKHVHTQTIRVEHDPYIGCSRTRLGTKEEIRESIKPEMTHVEWSPTKTVF